MKEYHCGHAEFALSLNLLASQERYSNSKSEGRVATASLQSVFVLKSGNSMAS